MDRYFKYLSSVGARPTLANGTLRWSRPTTFNDLFDMAVPFSTELDVNQVTQRALDLMWDRIQKLGTQPSITQNGGVLGVAHAAKAMADP